MILPSDRGYRGAKRARQGNARLDPRFDGFVAGFRKRFGFGPLWLETDHLRHSSGSPARPRLNVVLERTPQYRSFHTADHNYDPAKQGEIAALFAAALSGVDLRQLFRLKDWPPRTSPGADIFVCFSDFEQVAKHEAHQSVTEREIGQFTATLGLGDNFWCVQRLFGPPVVFVHTDEQAAALAASPVRDRWADDYFALVQAHDEFGYLLRTEIAIEVDSKENFDLNYEGNWYYYFK